jgi:uncharacterized protein YraI
MNTVRKIVSVALLASAGFASQAAAQQTVVTQQQRPQYVGTATVDLNIRSGPGPEHPVIGAIRAKDQATIIGCIEGSQWCQIRYRGETGWAYSQYMSMQVAQTRERVIVSERPATVAVPSVTYERAPAPPTTTTVTTTRPLAPPPASGTIVTRTAPARTVTTTTGVAPAPLAITPPAEVGTYVTSNPLDPVYLNGEVVVGAGLPETVELEAVPNYEYRYVYVNRQPVLVDPDTRRIVYIYR